MNADGHRQFIASYVERSKILLDFLNESLGHAIPTILPLFMDAWKNGKTIYAMGNGGSAASASHFINDLAKWTIAEAKPRVRAVCLNDNIPLMLAWANDSLYENVFVEQLKNLMQPGDVVIGISGSGNSKNVIRAIEYANANNAITVGVVGYDGGELIRKARHAIHVPSHDMQHAENMHLVALHLLTELLRQEIGKERI